MRRELEDRIYWQTWMANPATLRVVGLGAPAKATVWLNFMGFNADAVAYVVDSTPTKWGLYIPGTDIPILKRQDMLQFPPYAMLIFAHNYVEEILRWIEPFHSRGCPIYNVATRERVA